MLNGNLSKPVQLNRKSIGASRGNAKKELILDEPKNLNAPLKRKPSIEVPATNNIARLNKKEVAESNLATRPEPISKAALEEARAKRATKSAAKQVVVTQKTKSEKPVVDKKEIKHKAPTEKVKKKSISVEKPVYEEVNKESTKVKDDESKALMLEIKLLKEKQKAYQEEIKELKEENLASIKTIRALEKEKRDEYQNKRDIELKKKLLESGHQQNIDKIQNLIRNCRMDIKNQFENFIKSDSKIKLESHSKKKNNSSIISLLLCDKSYDKGLLDQLIMIEESNENIWGLSSRDLKELNSILNFYGSIGMDSNEIKEHLSNLNWFLDTPSQQYSSIPYITNSLNKLYQDGANFEEFLTFLFVPLFSSSHYSYLDQLFDLFDMDNDSYISIDDLKGVVREIEWEDSFTINDLKYLLRQMSTNDNNEEYEGKKLFISRGEFNDFFRSILD
ncbi:hypothetical protein RS030_2257 [Cryptosporidium xiaoi]|uniref:EF-hand domain-containing protein n=1 Tax=Cryptosporidium xiaoi TaxID=659607 RepID=A0AAV9XW93_9CRYT